MHVPLQILHSEAYFQEMDREIDWDETNDPKKVSVKQADEIFKILTCEAAIFLLRRATGSDGGNVDTMVSMRRSLINDYEMTWEPYNEHNDFY
jgi:hypothetical protein